MLKYVLLIVLPFSGFAQIPESKLHSGDSSLSYVDYHLGINKAEELIFVKNHVDEGLELFEKLFASYNFVFVDDCLEAFQLAIYYNQEQKALFFLKRAIDNGFRIEYLDSLFCSCPHDMYQDRSKNVTVFNSFVEKNKSLLINYQNDNTGKFLKGINRKILTNIIDRHIKEQINKQCGVILGNSIEDQKELYYKIVNDNLAYIDSLFQEGTYIGEKNLGILNYEALKLLNIEYMDGDYLCSDILIHYNLPPKTDVPFVLENDKSGINILYNILFHNVNSFKMLSKYKDDAITKGFLHPREYASLMYNKYENGKIPEKINMHLNDYWVYRKNTKSVNKLRELYYLPTYETDYEKHFFAHKNCLKLSFGFANGTR